MKRYRLRVPAAEAEPALARMLDLFPGGLEEERDGGDVILAGYAERAPAAGLEAEDVEPGWEDRWRAYHRPVTVGRIWIGPPWCPQPASGARPHVVVDRPGAGVRHRRSRLDACGARALAAARARARSRPRLRVGCALDRRREARLRGRGGARHRPARDRRGGRERGPQRRRARGRPGRRAGRPAARGPALDREPRARPPAPAPAPAGSAGLHPRLGPARAETLGGGERVVVDGWAAELVRP